VSVRLQVFRAAFGAACFAQWLSPTSAHAAPSEKIELEEEPDATSATPEGTETPDATAEADASVTAEGEMTEAELTTPTAEDAEGRPSPLELRAGMRLYSRSFRYTDTLDELYPTRGYPDLVTYNVAAAPMAFGHGTWYPAAHFTGGWPAHIGITGGYEQGFATHVQYGDTELDQNHSMWWVGPKVRVPIQQHDVGIFATYGIHNFEVIGDDVITTPETGTGTVDEAFPDVRYEFFDFGLDAHFRFDQLRIGAHAAYRLVVNPGPILSSEWFRNVTTQAVTFGGEVGWQVAGPLEILVGLDALQYGMDFNPVSTTRPDGTPTPANRVAGGATDRYLSVWAALAYVLPGQEATTAATPAGEDTPAGKEPAPSEFDSFDEF
jgi:hypothetical protein